MNYNVMFQPYECRPVYWDKNEIGRRLTNLKNMNDVCWLRRDFLAESFYERSFGGYSRQEDIFEAREILNRLQPIAAAHCDLYPLFQQAVYNFTNLTQLRVDRVDYIDLFPFPSSMPVYVPPPQPYRFWHNWTRPSYMPRVVPPPCPVNTFVRRVIPATECMNAIPRTMPAPFTASPSGNVTFGGRVVPNTEHVSAPCAPRQVPYTSGPTPSGHFASGGRVVPNSSTAQRSSGWSSAAPSRPAAPSFNSSSTVRVPAGTRRR